MLSMSPESLRRSLSGCPSRVPTTDSGVSVAPVSHDYLQRHYASDGSARLLRLFLAHDASYVIRQATAYAIGSVPCEQFVEQHAERINVA